MRFVTALLLAVCTAASGQELLAADSHHPAAIDTTKEAGRAQDRHQLSPAWQANVTGTYKGTWRRLETQNSKPPLLEKQSGVLFYRITASAGSLSGLHNVEGDLIVRDGEVHSEDDLNLRLKGVYVSESKRLHAVLQPLSKSTAIALHDQDIAERSPAYRQALRELAGEWTQTMQGHEDVSEDDILGRIEMPMRKRCDFVLDFVVDTLPVARETGTATPGRRLFAESPSKREAAEAAEGFVLMNGTLQSTACGISLGLSASSTKLDVYYAKAVRYTLMITGLSFLQILLLLPQIEATGAPVLISKVSLLTIGQQAIMDAYLCLLHLTTGIMVDPLFNSFATAAFLEFVIFAIFEMRYLLMIWRVRRATNMDPWAQQRELSVLYARFYSALLGGIFISYQLQRWMQVIVFGVFSFWIPQIVLCAYHEARQPLKAYYVLGMSASRLALPLYLYGCPHNLLRNPTSITTCVLLSVYVSVQVLLLLGQSYLGPRFFIPQRFLPPKYDYHRPADGRTRSRGEACDLETGDAGAECVICMNPVDVLTPQARMLTPCSHVFHPGCLQRWMEVKMECPTCRSPLPLT